MTGRLTVRPDFGVSPLTLIFTLVLAAGAASAQDVQRGAEAFQTHCATCHGTAADGTGTMAIVMTVPPADLPQLSTNNAGAFPLAGVVRRIDGTYEVLSHGGPMPLWGMILDGPSAVIVDVDGTEVIAPEIIVDVAAWLRTVQQ